MRLMITMIKEVATEEEAKETAEKIKTAVVSADIKTEDVTVAILQIL